MKRLPIGIAVIAYSLACAVLMSGCHSMRSGVDRDRELVNLVVSGTPADVEAALRSGKLDPHRTLAYQADPRSRIYHVPPLALAAGPASDIETMRVLLRSIDDVNARDSLGRTALHWAVTHYDYTHHQLERIALLLEAGADPNAQANGGGTPVFSAIASSPRGDREPRYEALKMLLKHGGDPSIRNRHGLNAYDRAGQFPKPISEKLLQILGG